MIILTIRTDRPKSEIGLFEDEKELAYETWQAHRQLAETVHKKTQKLLTDSGKNLNDMQGIVIFKGPGSFTGLRIGISVANALATSLDIPIIASEGKDWLKSGIANLLAGQNDNIALPEYGAPVHVTQQKK